MAITRDRIKEIRVDVQNALDMVARTYGGHIGFKVGGIRYDSNSFRITVNGFDKNAGENVYEVEWGKYHALYGFAYDELGKTFSRDGDVYAIVGLKKANRKYPIIARKVSNGKEFKFTADTVRALLDLAAE